MSVEEGRLEGIRPYLHGRLGILVNGSHGGMHRGAGHVRSAVWYQWIWVGVRNEGDQSGGSGDAGLTYFYCLINGGNDGVC